jgi:hypothetical protein
MSSPGATRISADAAKLEPEEEEGQFRSKRWAKRHWHGGGSMGCAQEEEGPGS